MKKLIIILLVVLPASFVNAAGINFLINPEWASVLKKAKEEKKLIFFDAFATWCGPCKAMDSLVYSDPAVAEYYNANFINVKYDMETGEGIDLAKKLMVTAYPALFFINDQENVVHKDLGYKTPGQFIALGKKAIYPAFDADAEYNALKAKATTLSPAEFLKFSEAAEAAEDEDYDDLVKVFLSKQPDVLANNDLIEILMTWATYLPDEKVLAYVLSNRDKIKATGLYEDEQIKQRMVAFTLGYAVVANTNEDDGETDLESVKVLLNKYVPKEAPFTYNVYLVTYYLERAEQDKALASFKAIVEAPPEDASFDQICNIFITYAPLMNEEGQLDKLFAMLDAYKIPSSAEPTSFYKDLVKTAVYAKLKDMDKFKLYAEKVIQNNDTPDDIKGTFKDLIEKLK